MPDDYPDDRFVAGIMILLQHIIANSVFAKSCQLPTYIKSPHKIGGDNSTAFNSMGVFLAWLCALCVLVPTARGEGLEAPTLRGTVGQLEDADLEVTEPRELQEKDVFPGKKLGSFSENKKHGENRVEVSNRRVLASIMRSADAWALHRVSFRWIHRKPTFTMSYVLAKRHPVAAQTYETHETSS